MLTVAEAQQSCWRPELLNDPRVPSCAGQNEITFPDASQPTAAVFLSYIVSRNDELIVKTYDLIKKFAPETKLNILISKKGLESYPIYRNDCLNHRTNVNSKYICRMEEVLNDSRTVSVIKISKDADQVYPQDYLQFGMTSNLPVLFPAINPFETTDYVNSDGSAILKTYIQNDVSLQCGMQNLSLNVTKLKGSPKTMGGNIETVPGGDVVMGANNDIAELDRLSDDQIFNQARGGNPQIISDAQIRSGIEDMRRMVISTKAQESLLSSKIKSPLKIDTSLAPVGHADEMFSVVRSNADCGFSILAPSPALAIQIMKNSRKNEAKGKCISNSFNGRPTFGHSGPLELSVHADSGCVGFRGDTFSDFLSDPKKLQLNEQFEAASKRNILLIQKSLASSGCTSADVVRLPYLISSSAQAVSEGVIPNPVNALVITPVSSIGSIYINNPTFVSAFDTFIEKELSTRGITMSLVKSSDYFSGQGGLHCGSSTLQLCKQR